MDLSSLIPERSVEDILAGRIRVSSGGRVYDLPVLSIRKNRDWRAQVDASLTSLLSAVDADGNDIAAILSTLASATDQLVDLLISYDTTGILPDREAIENEMTDVQALRAVLEVWAAANPLVGIGLATMSTTAAPETNGSSTPTTLPSPAGRASRTRPRSKAG